MAAKCKLQYFDARGRAELARLIIYASNHGEDVEDVRLKQEQWKEEKPKTPYGELPVLVFPDGHKINQSGAIFRYLARKYDLYGKNNIENTQCDVVLDTVTDAFEKLVKTIYGNDEAAKEEAKKKFKEEIFPKFLDFFEKWLQDKQYLVGDKLSVADLSVYDFLNNMELMKMDPVQEFVPLIKKSKNVAALEERVRSNPGVMKWTEISPKTPY